MHLIHPQRNPYLDHQRRLTGAQPFSAIKRMFFIHQLKVTHTSPKHRATGILEIHTSEASLYPSTKPKILYSVTRFHCGFYALTSIAYVHIKTSASTTPKYF